MWVYHLMTLRARMIKFPKDGVPILLILVTFFFFFCPSFLLFLFQRFSNLVCNKNKYFTNWITLPSNIRGNSINSDYEVVTYHVKITLLFTLRKGRSTRRSKFTKHSGSSLTPESVVYLRVRFRVVMAYILLTQMIWCLRSGPFCQKSFYVGFNRWEPCHFTT